MDIRWAHTGTSVTPPPLPPPPPTFFYPSVHQEIVVAPEKQLVPFNLNDTVPFQCVVEGDNLIWQVGTHQHGYYGYLGLITCTCVYEHLQLIARECVNTWSRATT